MTSVEIVPANSNSETELLTTLRRYWGYTTFRPLQESIVGSLLGGHDTCVVMPTGGGKSLCYQLPAVMLGRTAVVVSPLIALMQDQSAQLAQMGIPAGVLNSSMPNEKQVEIMRRASHGWRGRTRSAGCKAYRSHSLRSTKPIAYPSGDMNSALNTAS